MDQTRLADDDCKVGVSLVDRLLSEEQLLAASNGPPDSIVHLVVDKRAKPDRCTTPLPAQPPIDPLEMNISSDASPEGWCPAVGCRLVVNQM